jgi:putative inorganic carbon (hco3(-)) transporter
MRDALILLVIGGLLPFCIIRPWIGILVWTWLGLMNPHRLSWELDKLPIAMTVALLIFFGMLFRRDYKSPPWNRELILLALLMAYFTLTSVTAWYPLAAWEYWQRVVKMVGMLFVTTMLIHGRQRIEMLLLVVATSIGFYGLKGGLSTIATGGQLRVLGPEGTMIGGNTFIGLAMVMILPLLFAIARQSSGRSTRMGFFAVAGMTLLAIPFTYSRGALLGLAVVIPGIFPRLKRLIIFLPLLIPLVFIVKDFLPERLINRAQTIETYRDDASAMQRIRAWNVSFGIAKDRPLLGAGFDFEELPDHSRWWSYVPPDLFEYGDTAHVAHSIFFSVLGHHGFIALAMFMALLFFTFFDFRHIERRTESDPDLAWIEPYARALRIGLVGYCVSGSFLNAAYFDLMYLFVAFTALFRREILDSERRRKAYDVAPGQDLTSPLGSPTQQSG